MSQTYLAQGEETPDNSAALSHGATENVVVGITTPSRQATMAGVMYARIARIEKGEGATVAEGEVVVALDDAVQRARVAIAEATANSTLEVDRARVERDRTKQDLERLERLSHDSSASRKELQDARTLVLTSQLEFELALFNHGQAMRALAREQATLADYHIRAPFSGYVVEHLKHEGETVDHLEGIVALVQLDPLRITVDCPLSLGARIKSDMYATVMPVGMDLPPREGRVTYVSPIIDAGSQTIRVKVDVENADAGWMAGMKVAVTFGNDERAQVNLATQRMEPANESESPSAAKSHDRP